MSKKLWLVPFCLVSLICSAEDMKISTTENYWQLATPSERGVDGAILEKLHKEFQDGAHGYVNSFLVVRGGDLVFERYYDVDYKSLTKNSKIEQAKIMAKNYGENAISQYNYHDSDWHPFYRDTKLHTIQSVTKSVTSALYGIAIRRGELRSLDEEIERYFPRFAHLFKDPVKNSITIRDLLTMSAGIKWDEFTHLYTNPLNDAASMESSDDWLKFILSPPMAYAPGERFVYNSGITILLSHILEKAVNMPVDKYAQRYLFETLGIKDFYWKKTPRGLTDTESGLYLSSRDFAKFGQLYLDNGIWQGSQILPKGWVESTMKPAFNTGYKGNSYGFQWWLAPYDGGGSKWMLSGSGYGGQYLLIIPEHELVMVFNGWNIFDVERPGKEYLASRIIAGIDND
jgi:CubicO group peptidase (beta-lactamase class C family)